jgi:hypothetical protein
VSWGRSNDFLVRELFEAPDMEPHVTVNEIYPPTRVFSVEEARNLGAKLVAAADRAERVERPDAPAEVGQGWARAFDRLGEGWVKDDVYHLERGVLEAHVLNGVSLLRETHPLPRLLEDWIREYAERAEAYFGWPSDWRTAHEEEYFVQYKRPEFDRPRGASVTGWGSDGSCALTLEGDHGEHFEVVGSWRYPGSDAPPPVSVSPDDSDT